MIVSLLTMAAFALGFILGDYFGYRDARREQREKDRKHLNQSN